MPPAPSSDETPLVVSRCARQRLSSEMALYELYKPPQIAPKHPSSLAFASFHDSDRHLRSASRSRPVLATPTLFFIMAHNLPPATISDSDLALMGMLDDDTFLNHFLGQLPAGFDFQTCAPNALNLMIPGIQGNVCAPVYSQSPGSVLSPATSTGSLSSLGLETAVGDNSPSTLSVGWPGIAFQSPGTMSDGVPLPFLVGPSPPADLTARAAQGTPAHTISSVVAPSSAASSLVCQPVVSPANLVGASSSPAQGASLRQEYLFKCTACSLVPTWVSFPFLDLASVADGIISRLLHSRLLPVLFIPMLLRIFFLPLHPYLHPSRTLCPKNRAPVLCRVLRHSRTLS